MVPRLFLIPHPNNKHHICHNTMVAYVWKTSSKSLQPKKERVCLQKNKISKIFSALFIVMFLLAGVFPAQAESLAKPLSACAGYFAIRPELSGKRRLSWYFTLIISREPPNGQNLSLVSRVYEALDKTSHSVLDLRTSFRCHSQPCGSDGRKCAAHYKRMEFVKDLWGVCGGNV